MEKEYSKKLEEKIDNLSEEEKKLRNVYLRSIAIGETYGPQVGTRSIDKNFLKFYSEEGLKINYPELTMYEYMMRKNRDHMDDIALRYFGTTISYKKLDEKIDNAIRSFKQIGVQKGEIVTICMPNCPEAVITVYALNKMGAVANMIHPLSAENEIKNYLNEVSSKVVVTLDSSAVKINDIINKTSVKKAIVVSPSESMPLGLKTIYNLANKPYKNPDQRFMSWSNFMNLTKGDKSDVVAAPYQKNRLAVIMHTGGTTGNPKGAMLSDDNFNTMVEQFFQNEDNFERGDRLLTIMPVFHGCGLCSSIHLPLSVGVSSILIPRIDKKHLDKLITKEKPNHLIGVPTLYKGFINNKKLQNKKVDLSHLKYVVSGGDLVKDSLEEAINNFLEQHGSKAKLCKGYGLTEMVAGATFACNDYNNVNSIGIPMVGTDFKLIDSKTGEEINQDGVAGEMYFRGPSTMMGYYGNQTETDAALKDGWLHTGDMAKYENDLLYFVQRKGNMIISSGVNVYPSNIEEVIERHSAVASCVVIGVHHPYKMEVPKAYIVLKDGYDVTDELKKELRELCEKNLNIYSLPYDYEFTKELPQTLLGKVDRRKLSEQDNTQIEEQPKVLVKR